MNPRLSYLEGAARGAKPVRLVILLYAQAIEDLRRALAAHARGDIEGRTREINHALLVIGHLQGTLDKEQGGRVAANLDRFYNQVRSGLVDAQCRQSGTALEQQISHLMLLRDAWGVVEQSSPERTLPEQTAIEPSSTGQSLLKQSSIEQSPASSAQQARVNQEATYLESATPQNPTILEHKDWKA